MGYDHSLQEPRGALSKPLDDTEVHSKANSGPEAV